MKRVYLYSRFERFWHWSQAILIMALLATGFEIHGSFSAFGFERAFDWHNWMGWALIVLSAFAIFWHFTTGQWRHYLPIKEKLVEVCFYYTAGIFKGEPHPFEKHPDKKLNPLQRIAYLILKLLIMPIQFISGLLYYYYPQLPELGIHIRLETIAGWHTAGAFALLIFLIFHVYLTTTGKTVFSHLKGMITGWEEV